MWTFVKAVLLMIKQEEVYKIGILGKPHGVRGEIQFRFTDDVFDQCDAEYLVLNIDGILVPFFIEEYRFRSEEMVLIKFCNIDTEKQARELTGTTVYFPRAVAEENKDELSWAQIVGFNLLDNRTGKIVGKIISVDDSTITQALDVIEQHTDLYEVYALTANNQWEKLAAQARKFQPAAVVIANEKHYKTLQKELSDQPNIKIYAGKEALKQIVEAEPINMVVTAMVGFAGLEPTIHAIKARKKICLANKETLVVAGELICKLANEYHTPILPVDSEHSAIFQSLVGEDNNEIEKILLTCSGGPFRLFDADKLKTVTAADALKHPTWDMGAKITIDSASLMNKGFEVIEAKWLFGVPVSKIQVLVHPQSIVHSAVQFIDGSVKAQLGVPDMRLPIQYAFSFPNRLTLKGDRLNLFNQPLEFFEPDMDKFRCLAIAYEAIERGGNMPCILNAANEIVNEGFRKGQCSFLKMGEIINETMQKVAFDATPSLDVYLQTDAEARRIASELMVN